MSTAVKEKSLASKVLALLTSVALVLSFIPCMVAPQAALADEIAPSWYDAAETEYTLTTADQLSELAALVNAGNDFAGKTVKLGANIDLADRSWVAIGGADTAFAGTFDGQGNTISNVSLSATNGYAGLFGNNAGTVKNFTISGVIGTETDSYAGFAAMGVVAGQNAGTISGVINETSVYVSNSTSTPAGGIAGLNKGTITQCGNKGSLTAAKQLGGIAGQNEGTITECYNSGTITGTSHQKDNLGGIAGQAGGKSEDPIIENTISYCYNTGFINNGGENGGRYFGGIVGAAYNTGETITNCYSTNVDAGYSWQHNAIVGAVDNYQETIHDNYSLDTLVNGDTSEATSPNTVGIQKSATEMQSTEFVTLINGSSNAYVAVADSYPVLAWQNNSGDVPTIESAIELGYAGDMVRVGETFDVTVAVTHDGSIAAAQATISYDPSIAVVESVAYADGVENGSTDVDNTTGTTKISFLGDASFNAKNSVTIATLTFRAVAEGDVSVAVSDAVTGATSSIDDIDLAVPAVPLVVSVGEPVVFTVYTSNHDGENLAVAKEYTMSQLEELVDASADAVAGQYVKSGSMGVWASTNYVKFSDLFNDAGISWGEGYTAKWGGSPEKAGNVFTYEQLQGRQFLPAAAVDKSTGEITFSTEGAVTVEPSLALTAARAFASTASKDSATAAEARNAALAIPASEMTSLVPIIGASADEIASKSPAGKPYWTGTDSITVAAPAVYSVSAEPFAGSYYKVTYLPTAPQGNVVSMGGVPMYLDNGAYVALATAEQIAALKDASFTVSAGEAVVVAHDGDINANGKVNVVDAQIAYDIATGVHADFSQLSMAQWLNGDVNTDGVLDAADAFAIQYKALNGLYA